MNFKFSIKRLLIGIVLVAIPFAALSGFGVRGVVIATIIAVSMFTACLIASRAQMESMLGIFACTFVGFCLGSLLDPAVFNRHFPPYDPLLGSVVGCFVGLLWSHTTYAERMNKRK